MRRATFGGHLGYSNSLKRRLSGAFTASLRDGPKERESPFMSSSRPGSVSRLAGLSSKKADQGIQKDPRNLSNRGKQREMIDDILNFLQLNGYPHQISQKIMQAPSSKDFVRLFEFLYGMIDKREKIDKKFEEEVPRLLKQIAYPFPIPKSTMFTIGSLHTWPTLLGALHWLVKLIEYCKTVDPDELLFCQNREDPHYGCDKIIDTYLQKTYKDFLQMGRGEEEDDQRLTEALLRQTGAIKDDDEALKSEIEELEKELAELEEEPDRLKIMQDEISFYKSEMEKLEQQEQDLINDQKKLNSKLSKYNEELQEYDIERIQHKQAAGCTEVQQLLLTNRLAAAKEENEKLQTKCWEKEIVFSKTYNKVDKVLSEYNDLVRNLSCDKTATEYLQGEDVSMKFDHKENDVLDRGKFRDTIKDTLIQAQNRVSSDTHKLEAQRISEEDKFEKLTELCSEKQRETSLNQTRLDNLAKEVEALQMKATTEQEISENELAAIRKEIESLGTSSTTHLAKREQELVELKERVIKEKTEMKEKSQKSSEFLLKVVQKTVEHKIRIETRQKHELRAWDKACQQVKDLEVQDAHQWTKAHMKKNSGVEQMYNDKLKHLADLESKTYAWQNSKENQNKDK